MPSKHISNSVRANIRESVDSLYRDDMGEISRDPRTKRLKTSVSFFFRPAFSLLEQVEALIFSLKVSNFAGGVHGHQAIVSFLLLVTTVDHGALPWSH